MTVAFLLSELFINLSMRCRLGERRNCAGRKKVRAMEKEILGVSQSVSFAYISLVPLKCYFEPQTAS